MDDKVGECFEAIQVTADESDPVRSPDPIVFIYVFLKVLGGLVPEDVTRRHKAEIHEVLGQLAQIVVERDGSLWSHSRGNCIIWACRYIRHLNLTYGPLGYKLRALGRTLPLPAGNYEEEFDVNFELEQYLLTSATPYDLALF